MKAQRLLDDGLQVRQGLCLLERYRIIDQAGGGGIIDLLLQTLVGGRVIEEVVEEC
jgi:hypothetical protein